MGVATCLCNKCNYRVIAIPSAIYCPTSCRALRYDTNGCGLYSHNGKFMIESGNLKITIPIEHVDMTMFWYKLLSDGREYNIVMYARSTQVNVYFGPTTIVLTDNMIQIGDQTVKPYYPFKVEETDVVIGHVTIFDTSVRANLFIALSLAVNGAHILY